MPELRKRKEAPPAPAPVPKKGRAAKATNASNGDVPATAPEAATTEVPVPEKQSKTGPPSVGDTVDLNGFGGEVETNDGDKTTLKALVEQSKAGVVLFTYPKASTPGCTTQVCLFRDTYTPLTATGLSIYGLSTDSPKSNTTFKTKQNLPYTLLCDKAATLIGAIGLKNGAKTTRGVFVVTKEGKVLAAEPGGPAATVDVVKAVVEKLGGASAEGEKKLDEAEAHVKSAEGTDKPKGEDEKRADVADEVADTAAKLDK